ncbi:MAG TPA: hypothetical protein VHX38_24845 [Pseudonocardiaceae bacterium]|jgi:hypothetical protein|nr:hypothetical protein [Pseudonocardiaceae bacterium]
MTEQSRPHRVDIDDTEIDQSEVVHHQGVPFTGEAVETEDGTPQPGQAVDSW